MQFFNEKCSEFNFVNVTMKEVEHSVASKIITIILSVAISCRSTYAINTNYSVQAEFGGLSQYGTVGAAQSQLKHK